MTPEQAGSVLTINLKAVAENYNFLKTLVGENCICGAVLKADAYGLGATKIAETLVDAGCGVFFVAHLAEGIELRESLEDARIYVLHGPMPNTESYFDEFNLIPVLNTREQVMAWAKYAQGLDTTLDAVLHVDTGMHRLGLAIEDVRLLANSPSFLNGIRIDFIMSHLACADDPDNPMNEDQLKQFGRICQKLEPLKPYPILKSLAASGGIFLGHEYYKDIVRPGIALFGAIESHEMKPAVSLHSKIIQIQELEKNTLVGYGLTEGLKKDGVIATVPLGYADGYPRMLSRKGIGFIGTEMVRVLGRISMDLLVLDVSDVPERHLFIGQEVEFIGPNAPLSELARQAGTIEYEVLTHLGSRFYRSYIE